MDHLLASLIARASTSSSSSSSSSKGSSRPPKAKIHNQPCNPEIEHCPRRSTLSTGAIIGIVVGVVLIILGIALFVWWQKRSKSRARVADVEKVGGSSSSSTVNTAYMPLSQPHDAETHDTAPLVTAPMPLKTSSAAPSPGPPTGYSHGPGAASDYYDTSYSSGGYPQQSGPRPY